MKCKQVKILLPDFINKNLTKDKSNLIEKHLVTCDECKKLYLRLNASLSLLKPKKDIPEQAFYYTRLKSKMEENVTSKENIVSKIFNRKILQPVLYLSSIILAVYIGILIGSSSNNQNNLSVIEETEKSYTEIFAEYQYLNGFEIETLENEYMDENNLLTTDE